MPVDLETRRTLKSLIATLAVLWLGCAAYAGLEQLAGLLTFRDFTVHALTRLNTLTLFYWLPWVLFGPCVVLLSQRLPIRPESWLPAVAAHVLLLLALTLTHGLAVGVFYHYSASVTPYMATFQPWQHSGHFLIGDAMLLWDIIFYAVFAATFNIRNFQQIVRQQELDATRLNQRLAELRFQTLRMQINPHFLFNALNAVAVLIQKSETAKAGEAVTRLGRFFRQTLESSDEHWVPLADELEMVGHYIAIAKTRFGERLSVVEQCDPEARQVPVPTLLLQPLVENAIVHGLSAKIGPCVLSLECRVDGERLTVEIADDGVGGRFYDDPDFEEGVGLANVRARLDQMYAGTHAFRLESEPNRGTRITIELPRTPGELKLAV
jgi:two-component system LytT family sensor kinase